MKSLPQSMKDMDDIEVQQLVKSLNRNEPRFELFRLAYSLAQDVITASLNVDPSLQSNATINKAEGATEKALQI